MGEFDIFISYRRDGGEATARIIRDRLNDKGYRVFFDMESLQSGDFNTKLYSVIDECTDFIAVLSPNALDRCQNENDWVRKEIRHALEKEKNIIPVTMRGFTYKTELPDDIATLKNKNGIEANSQFFDAFIDTLCTKFLKSKPSLFNLIRKRTKLIMAAAVAVVVIAAAAFAYNNIFTSHDYPLTEAEKSLTSEVIYYTDKSLSSLDMMSGYYSDALDSGKDFLETGDSETLLARLNSDYQTIEAIDFSNAEPSEELLERAGDSPFDVAELRAQYDIIGQTRDEYLNNIEVVYRILDGDLSDRLTDSQKREAIEIYEGIHEEYVKVYGWSVNEILIAVNDEALTDFFDSYAPMLNEIRVSRDTWLYDKAELDSLINDSLEEIDEYGKKYQQAVGVADGE